MSIKACPECGKDVSTEAATCPHCGAKPNRRVLPAYLMAILGGLIVTALITGVANEPGPTEAERACAMAREFVKERLKAPATASFSECTSWQEPGGGWEVKGYVDSENSFGVKLRAPFFVRLSHAEGNEWTASNTQVGPEAGS